MRTITVSPGPIICGSSVGLSPRYHFISPGTRVGELSLNNDTDLGTGVMVDWKHRAGHDRDPGKRQFGIFEGGRDGTAEDFARDDRGEIASGSRLGERREKRFAPTPGSNRAE